MPTRIRCPHCQHDLRLPEDLEQQEAQCPICDGAFVATIRRAVRRSPREILGGEVDAAGRRPCRFCGEPVQAQAVKCPSCNEWLDR